MLCNHCEKVGYCSTYYTLCTMSKDFDIKDCRNYDEASEYKYRLIARNDKLMRAIYDYFTNNLDLPKEMDDEKIKECIKTALLTM